MAAVTPKPQWVRGGLAGKRLGGYLLERLIGEGGMGEVYAARDQSSGRRVAIKILIEANARAAQQLPGLRERFEQEWRVLKGITHPNVVALLDWPSRPDGPMYFAMELLEGETLAAYIDREGRIPIELAVHIGIQLANGLAAVHAAGTVHRDVKPQNVFLCNRTTNGPSSKPPLIKLLDFGLARVVGSRITGTGLVVGTPAYVAPEQAAGDNVDVRTDIYALGLVLYHAVTGQHPFYSDDQVATLGHQLLSPPPPLQWLREETPHCLETLILRMLRKLPANRPASMEEVAANLREIERGGRPTFPPHHEEEDRYGPLNALAEALVRNALVPKGFGRKGW